VLYRVNHVHIKSKDPKETADWYVKAFNFKIISDNVRSFGDRFIGCADPTGFTVNISGARTGESLGPGDADAHYGLEHFGVDVENIEAEIARLTGLGAELKEGPIDVAGGPLIAFLNCPVDTRVELIQPRG
jgi:catechol 2,3-dioxygenase-like lactoylglutathione lyase family enzyme